MAFGFLALPASARTFAPVNASPWLAPTDKGGTELSHWIVIDPDGTITVVQPHAEMGQGALTSVAMMLNEELQADWNMIRMQYADFNRHITNKDPLYPDAEGLWVTMQSGGSNVVKARHTHIQQAGASARERLKEAAAQAWGVSRDQVAAKDSMLTSGNRTGTYAEFATAAAAITFAEEPAIKMPDQFTLLGTSMPRVDIPLKVDGSAQYPADMRLPGMVYAAVVNNPAQWDGGFTYDATGILDRPGVLGIIELDQKEPGKNHYMDLRDGLAVVADTYYRAKTALELIQIQWNPGPASSLSTDDMFAAAWAKHDLPLADGMNRGEEGDAMSVIAAANPSSVITADYQRPYESHLRPEPITHTAQFRDGRYDAWVGAQHPPRLAERIIDQLGIPIEDTYLHRTFLGGGFSSSSGTYLARAAAEIAKTLNGPPVQVRFSREEDTRNAIHRTMGAVRFTAALGADGLPNALTSVVVSDGNNRFANQFNAYGIPNRLYTAHALDGHVSTTSHRNPTGGFGGFMVEQFVDEMAQKAGWDPLEWRLHMSRDVPDWQLVLNTLKEKGGFRTDLPQGSGMGVACVESHGTIVGQVATVSVSRRGAVRVEKVVNVMDPGHIINPHNCEEQAEGSIVWGLSHSLMGGIEIQNGAVVNVNFDTMKILRMGDMPEIETHFALSGGEKWGGMGEPSVAPIGAAVANAIFYATGKRGRSNPLLQHDFSWG
jgi:isoquinoline 1-oxidoreductase beta subunit